MADLAPPLLKTRPATAYASTLHPSPSDPAPTPNASRLHTARGGKKRASLPEYQKEQVNNKQLNNEQPYRSDNLQVLYCYRCTLTQNLLQMYILTYLSE